MSQSLLNEVKFPTLNIAGDYCPLCMMSQSLLNEVKFPTLNIAGDYCPLCMMSQSLLNEVKFPTSTMDMWKEALELAGGRNPF